MRVIAGKYKGIALEAPAGYTTRPTADRIKEALFSIFHFQISNLVVLDLYAGSGALGIEALSRGARFVYFNDTSHKAQLTIQQNLRKLKNCENYEVSSLDALFFIQTQKNIYDMVLLDPPYDHQNYTDLVQALVDNDRLAAFAAIGIECDCEKSALQFAGFKEKVYKYGTKCLIILQKLD